MAVLSVYIIHLIMNLIQVWLRSFDLLCRLSSMYQLQNTWSYHNINPYPIWDYEGVPPFYLMGFGLRSTLRSIHILLVYCASNVEVYSTYTQNKKEKLRE